jgi:hypothetical protein
MNQSQQGIGHAVDASATGGWLPLLRQCCEGSLFLTCIARVHGDLRDSRIRGQINRMSVSGASGDWMLCLQACSANSMKA